MNPLHRTRAMIAICMADTLARNVDSSVRGAKVQDHVSKVRRWIEACHKTLGSKPVAVPASHAVDAICNKAYQQAVALDGADLQFSALALAAHTFIVDVRCVSPEFRRMPCWRYLEQTVWTLTQAFTRLDPRGEEAGTEIYMECAA